ncbi:uncharacterized protein LOC114261824 [Camellia sinensis]|uniref:uncharacterized protein LOC114261824 n=1 Tax=Camellia sinensis TaxID=4442 RepID=UPI001036C926|nr:uncharacterized protein LOC114261824 [Camellia sinensis]
MEYWDHEGLSRIASKIGVPLFMDHLTSTGTRVSFARVCVEVDVTSELPHQFFLRCEDEVVEIKVEYQGLPAKCEHCRVFGHDTKKCVTAQVEKLTQMQKVTGVAIEDEWQHVKDKGKKKVRVPEGDVQTVEHTPLPPVETAAKVVLEEGLNHVDDPLQLLHKEIQGLASALNTVAEAPFGLEEPVDEVDTEEEMLAAMVDKLSTPRKKARQQGETSRQNSSGKSSSQRKKKKGFNESSKHKEVRNFVVKNDIKVMSLLELKIKSSNEKEIFGKVFSNWGFLSNALTDSKATVWVCWDPNFCDIQCLKMSNQYMFCKITLLEGDITFFGTFVYDDNKHVLRVLLFKDILDLLVQSISSPFVCMGDFNVIRCPSEKVGGTISWSGAKEEFNKCIQSSDLTNLFYIGCQFTWANKRGDGAFIASKLNRVLVNETWLTKFPHSCASFLPSSISDHSPGLLDIDPNVKSLIKPFKFFDFWGDHEDFVPSVSGVWCKYIRGSPMFRICQKLKALKPILKDMNKKEYSEISTRVTHAKASLESAQIKLDKDPLNTVEEGFAHQKSRVQWLGLGDRNSRFFFRSIKGNINRNKIHCVTLSSGEKLSKAKDVCRSFVKNFTDIFGTKFNDTYNGLERLHGLVNKKVSPDQFVMLSKEVTDTEIKDTFWSLKANKAPGPDGYPTSFFRKAWDVVGNDVVAAIKSFFTSGELLQEVNNTIIALVPKVPNPSKVGDYRPISCYNTIY